MYSVSLSSGPGVSSQIRFFEFLKGDSGVKVGGAEVLVPEQSAYHGDAGSVVQEMSCEASPDRVTAERFEPCGLGLSGYKFAKTSGCKSIAMEADDESLLAITGDFCPDLEVSFQNLLETSTQGKTAVLSALALVDVKLGAF